MNNVTPAAMGMGSVMPYPQSPPTNGATGVDPQTINGMNQAYYGQSVPSAIPDYSKLQAKKGPFSFITDWFDHLPTWLKITVGAAGSVGLFFATKHVVLNAGTWVRDAKRAFKSVPWAKYATKAEKKEIKRNMYELHDLRSEAKDLVAQVAADTKTIKKLEEDIVKHSAEINVHVSRAAKDSVPQWAPNFVAAPWKFVASITARYGGLGYGEDHPRRKRIVANQERLQSAEERLKELKARVEENKETALELGKKQFKVQQQLALKAIEQKIRAKEAGVEELKGRKEEAEARLKELGKAKADANKIKAQRAIIKNLEDDIVNAKIYLDELQDMTYRTWANAKMPKNVGVSASGMPYAEGDTYFNAEGKCTIYGGLTLPEPNPIIRNYNSNSRAKVPSNVQRENKPNPIEWLLDKLGFVKYKGRGHLVVV
jgi:hypothetical protein